MSDYPEPDAWGLCNCAACGGCFNGGAAPDGRCGDCQAGRHGGPLGQGPATVAIEPVQVLRTRTGRLITDEMLTEWAEEANRGYCTRCWRPIHPGEDCDERAQR